MERAWAPDQELKGPFGDYEALGTPCTAPPPLA